MSVRSARIRLVRLALVVALPVPIWLLGPGRVPRGQLVELGSAAVAFGVAESFRGVVGLTAVVFLGQALVYARAAVARRALLARALGTLRGAAARAGRAGLSSRRASRRSTTRRTTRALRR